MHVYPPQSAIVVRYMSAITLDRPRNASGAAAPRSGLTRSRLRQLALLAGQPGLLSLAGGLPAPELIPRTAYATALRDVLDAGVAALQYGQPHEPLRERIVELMRERGVGLRAPAGAADVGGPAGAEPRRPAPADDAGPTGCSWKSTCTRACARSVLPHRPCDPDGRAPTSTPAWTSIGAWKLLARRGAAGVRLRDRRHPQPVRGASRSRATRATRGARADGSASRSSRTIPTGCCTTTRTRCPPCAPWTPSG